ncbi:MAG TPA: protein kinase, partial [Acidobacteriota bacterium]|nr:protein kinase [Acidobacteriota bacterium]
MDERSDEIDRLLLDKKASDIFDSPFPFTFGHYQVLRKIGEGGMGKVYLVEDKLLPRKVALKILRGQFTKEHGRLQRFQNEARAASSLNHPNILTVYEIGRENEIPFIATEYVEGKTLRIQLATGKIKTREAIDIAIQTCSALAAAHEAGIVHRDIKPENIMLRPDGIVKVVDFGVSKMIETADSNEETKTNITMEGEVIGTVKYMSPEQVRGQPVDARSDIFSLGIVLFEILTGIAPFEGKTKSDVIASILQKDVPNMTNYLPGISKELESIVRKMLQKDRHERYQTVTELLEDLRPVKQHLDASADTAKIQKASSIQAPRISFKFLAPALAIILLALVGYYRFRKGTDNIESIAVLPFINESKQAELEYLTDGLTESIIRSLSMLPNVRVMARSTMFRYKRKEVDARTVGKDLGVRAVLTGRVIQQGDDLQISLELADARDNSYIWGNRYQGKTANLLSIQSDIATDISNKLSDGEKRIDEEHYTDNVEAYNLYLKGRYFWNKRTKDGLEKAILHFRQALDIDSNYALAWSGLADCYISQSFYEYAAPAEAMPNAKAAAMKALEIDESLAEAHITLAHVAVNYDWNWKASEKEFKRGIELNPNYATGHQWYAIHYLMPMRRFDETLIELRQAQQLEPLSPLMTTFVGEALYFNRRYKEAENECRKALDLEPNFPVAH